MTKIIMEGQISEKDVSVEDMGMAVILDPDWKTQGCDEHLFVRIQSYNENLDFSKDNKYERAKAGHASAHALIGKKVRVTIEVIEDN